MIRTDQLKKVYRTEEVETTALDEVNIEINEGATVIMVTHSQYCAEFGNRIVRLLDGQVVRENSVTKQWL